MLLSSVLCSLPLRRLQPTLAIRFRCSTARSPEAEFAAAATAADGERRGPTTVLELGAGVCGLPSILLARKGCQCVATDLGDILPLLRDNLHRNAGDSATAAELPWGDAAAASAVARSFPGAAPDWIVAADVVYHEHLIEPLLQTLVELTRGPKPPKVLMSYVQRFKRAKSFFKLMRKHFVVEEEIVLPDVVDYDVITHHYSRLPYARFTDDAVPQLRSTSAFASDWGIPKKTKISVSSLGKESTLSSGSAEAAREESDEDSVVIHPLHCKVFVFRRK
jgi:hypothetical protein